MVTQEKADEASADQALTRLLAQGATRMGIALPPAAQQQLIKYLRLLAKWNKTFNLTAVADPVQGVSRHLLDSLSAVPYIKGPRILDVGTGGGLPGIPLAVVFPGDRFVLLDSTSKKTRFVTQVTIELGLPNVSVENCRLEDYHPAEQFDTVITRAVTKIDEFVSKCGRFCHADGWLVAMKGRFPEHELAGCDYPAETVAVDVPGQQGERHIVRIKPMYSKG